MPYPFLIPVENDVEYLFVEGLYFTWKASGDSAWMKSCLDAGRLPFRFRRLARPDGRPP